MGIKKIAKNIKVTARSTYNVQAGVIDEVADFINIEAFKDDLTFNSSKEIEAKGHDGGVKFAGYTPPELQIEESEYKLESRFAMEQLFAFAEKDSMAMFCFWMADIFGGDIPLAAYEQLYKDASDKKEAINPKITVALDVPGKGAAYYTGTNEKYKNHIIVSQGFIDNALENNHDQQLLMIALVEEFGHHLDYILRKEYSGAGGDSPGDEGARYTSHVNRKYKRYLIDPFEQSEQHYATATIKGAVRKLIWDFSDLHEKLKAFVDNRVAYDDNYFAGFEFFGAGLGDDLHGLGHQAIEEEAFKGLPVIGGENNIKRKQIYFGNWLRDFSQFIDPMVIRPVANALDMMSNEYKAKNVNKENNEQLIEDLKCLMAENRVTRDDLRTYDLPADVSFDLISFDAQVKWEATTFSPVKMSRQAVTTLVELIGLKEFGELKETPEDGKPQNYMKYLKDFRSSFTEVTPELLGVYKPQEHIDNPMALLPKEGDEKDLNNKLDPDFVKDPVKSQWDPNRQFGTKNYIRGNGRAPFPSAYDCFISFINKSNPNTVAGRINFGAAMHILEDYYAHSNFCELAVMKVYDPEVFPWDNLPETCVKGTLKEHKADIASNRHAAPAALLDRSKIRYQTLTNIELLPAAVRNYMKAHNTNSPSAYYRQNGEDYDPEKHYRNRGLYYSHAECAYVQTGSFGKLDTIASIAPKVNSKIFSIKIEEQEDLKPGERTFNDALIYELLKDISKAQASDTKEKNARYKGKDDGKYAAIFMKYLEFRDFMLTEPMKTIGKLLNAFGIFDYITQYIKVIRNTFYHFLALTAINLIDDYQTYLDNELTLLEEGNWKVNSYGPTHTQLAKDNGLQPLHHLAVKLATSAVNEFGKLFVSGTPQSMDAIRSIARDKYFVHPMYTDWMDAEVIEWCINNKGRVRLARESSVVLWGIQHGLQEVQELINEVKLLNDFNATEEQQEKFNSAYAKIPDKWHRLWEKMNRIRKARGLGEAGLSDDSGYDELQKEKGYGN